MIRAIAIRIGGETLALPVHVVGPVVRVEHVTRVPLAGPDFAGLFNLRGKITPLIDLRRKLDPQAAPVALPSLAVCIDAETESFAVTVDDVGDVHQLSPDQRIEIPAHVGPQRAALTSALYTMASGLLPLLDTARLFEPVPAALSPLPVPPLPMET